MCFTILPVISFSKKFERRRHFLITAFTLGDYPRYGGTRADRTRLPMAPSEDEYNDESKFEANVKLERSECLRKESNVRFNYHNIIDKVYSN